jgi:hypothetical protein
MALVLGVRRAGFQQSQIESAGREAIEKFHGLLVIREELFCLPARQQTAGWAIF